MTLTFIWQSFRLKTVHLSLLLYTDLGRPRGTIRPKRALVCYFVYKLVVLSTYLIDIGIRVHKTMDIHTLALKQKGRHFPDDFFEWICLTKNV